MEYLSWNALFLPPTIIQQCKPSGTAPAPAPVPQVQPPAPTAPTTPVVSTPTATTGCATPVGAW
jgi:hypothetical protein